LAFYFHILTTMHGQNHIKHVAIPQMHFNFEEGKDPNTKYENIK